MSILSPWPDAVRVPPPLPFRHVGYRPSASPKQYWCISHKRVATHEEIRSNGTEERFMPHCDPLLGGIMLPCSCEEVK